MTLSDLQDNKRFVGVREFKISVVVILFGYLDVSMHISAIYKVMVWVLLRHHL